MISPEFAVQINLSSGGGFNISPAELPNISWCEGEYVPRVARALLTLLSMTRATTRKAMTRMQTVVMMAIRAMLTVCLCVVGGMVGLIHCTFGSAAFQLTLF